jgi:hypothetical protein
LIIFGRFVFIWTYLALAMLQRVLLLVLLVSSLTPAVGWVTTSQATYGVGIMDIVTMMRGGAYGSHVRHWQFGQLGHLWSYNPQGRTGAAGTPNTSNVRETMMGLGGGITWAWDPTLCAALDPLFNEDPWGFDLVDCAGYRAAVNRAFNNWAGNNRFIKFIDVTQECDKLYPNYPQVPYPARLHQAPDLPSHGGCPLAEIWVTAIKPNENAQGGDIAVATALSISHATTNFYYTNGERPFTLNANGSPNYFGRTFISVHAGTMSIATSGLLGGKDLCWYLDSYFCSHIHRWKHSFGRPSDARALVIAITWLLFAAGGAFVIFSILSVISRFVGIWQPSPGPDNPRIHALDRNGDGNITIKERLFAAMEDLAELNPLVLAIACTFVISPPLITYIVLLPCWDCADFEAAILHETGHFFGLGHPDYLPQNYYQPMANYNTAPNGENSYQAFLSSGGRLSRGGVCSLSSIWGGVMAGIPPGAASGIDGVDIGQLGYPVRNSLMEAFTQNNPKPCLTPDDVEALTVLYPDCEEATALSDVVCPKVNHNLGLVRIGLNVFLPMLICLIFIVTFNTIIHKFQQSEMDALIKEHAKEKKKMKRQASMEKKAAPLGQLSVKLHSASGLKAKDLNGKSDPYVIFQFLDVEVRSSVKEKTVTPKWEESIVISERTSAALVCSENLSVTVMDKDAGMFDSTDDKIGECVVSLSVLDGKKSHEFKQALSPKGTIHFTASFSPRGVRLSYRAKGKDATYPSVTTVSASDLTSDSPERV